MTGVKDVNGMLDQYSVSCGRKLYKIIKSESFEKTAGRDEIFCPSLCTVPKETFDCRFTGKITGKMIETTDLFQCLFKIKSFRLQ